MLHDLIIFMQQTLQQGLGEAGMVVLGVIGGGFLPRIIKTKAPRARQVEIDPRPVEIGRWVVQIGFMIKFSVGRHERKAPNDAKRNSHG